MAMAINMFGCDAIYEMVANAVAEQVLVIPLQAYSLEADEFWLSSVACAIAAECIAEECELDRNVAYTLGLLSGIGMVAIDHWIRANSTPLAFFKRTFPRDYCESEHALLGCTNSEVATQVLRSWDFPPEMCLPVRWQYAPWEAGSFRQLSALLHCAKWVSATVCAPQPGQVPAPAPRALEALKFNGSKLSRIVSVVESRLRDVQRRLEAQPLDAA
jgi:HD-like signal output (HDOD) protein